jgi:hypothetical protein
MAGYKSKAIVGTGGGQKAMMASSAEPISSIPMRGAMMTAGNFNRVAVKVSPGSGWFHTIPIQLGGVVWSSVTPALTTGALEAVMNNSGDNAAIGFIVPGNYDQNKDKLRLVVNAISTDATGNTLEIGDVRYWRDGAAAVADPSLSSTQDDSQTIIAATMEKYTFDLSSLGLKPYDSVTITLDCTVGGTSITIRGLAVEYCGSLVNADPSLRA